MTARVTVFIPTLNAGPDFSDVLTAIRDQESDFDFEIRAIDSGSNDGTQDVLSAHGVPFTVIDRSDFDHGETRNRAAREADTELVAFLSQDALPRDRQWLARLAAPFADERVAGAYARQVPREACHPFQRVNVERHMDAAATFELRAPVSVAEFMALAPADRLERIRFDNVSSLVRRAVLLEHPFPRAAFGEDLAWARTVLLAGHALAFCPGAAVRHSHPANRYETGPRVRLGHRAVKELTGDVPIPSRAWQLRRAAGLTLRYWRTTLKDPGSLRKLLRLLRAPWTALRVTNAMYLGGTEATFRPPL